MSTVRCKECNEEARLEEAYHAHYQGFRCKRCNARYEGELFAIGGILILACLLVFVATMVVNSLTGPKAEATFDTGPSCSLVDGKGGIERTEITHGPGQQPPPPEQPNLLLPHNQERPAPSGEMRDFH
jgi:hypothetical protein